MALNMEQALYYLELWGLSDVILPFMIIFVIIYATLSKAKIFGGESKKYNIIVALAIGLLVVVPHVTHKYPPGRDVVEIMNTAIPQVSVVAVAIIMFLVLVGMFGAETTWWGGTVSGIVVIASVIAIIAIFGNAIGWFQRMPSWLRDPSTQALVVIVLIFGLIVWFVTADSSQKGIGGVIQDLGNALKKK